ncbi:MAG: arginase family protein [Aminivibrio sp.]
MDRKRGALAVWKRKPHEETVGDGPHRRNGQDGLRGIGSSRREDFEDAKSWGSVLITSKEARRIGPEGVMARISKSDCYYVTIDIDGFDMSIARGTGSPAPGACTTTRLTTCLRAYAGWGRW